MFREPIQVGELVSFLAAINHTGVSSMDLGIRIQAENIQTPRMRHVNSCYFTMVAVDKSQQPKPVLTLRMDTIEQRQRSTAARARRELKQAFAQRFEALRSEAL